MLWMSFKALILFLAISPTHGSHIILAYCFRLEMLLTAGRQHQISIIHVLSKPYCSFPIFLNPQYFLPKGITNSLTHLWINEFKSLHLLHRTVKHHWWTTLSSLNFSEWGWIVANEHLLPFVQGKLLTPGHTSGNAYLSSLLWCKEE